MRSSYGNGIRFLFKGSKEESLYWEQWEDDAYDRYWESWNASCEWQGKGEGCILDVETAKEQDKRLKDLKDECFRRYPLK